MPDGNVIPLRASGIRSGDLPLPVEELSETVDAIGRCLEKISFEPGPVARPAMTTATPFLGRLTIVEQQFDKLSGITVTTWPDVRWALRFCNARVRGSAVMDEFWHGTPWPAASR